MDIIELVDVLERSSLSAEEIQRVMRTAAAGTTVEGGTDRIAKQVAEVGERLVQMRAEVGELTFNRALTKVGIELVTPIELPPQWDVNQDFSFREWFLGLLTTVQSPDEPENREARLARDFAASLMSDESVRATFRDRPVETLARFGVIVPRSLSVEVIENTVDTMYVVLPAVTSIAELGEVIAPIDLTESEVETFVSAPVQQGWFKDDFDRVSLRDGWDHDVDALPFQTDAKGDKYKTRAKNARTKDDWWPL